MRKRRAPTVAADIGLKAMDMLKKELSGEVYGVFRESVYCIFPGDKLILLHENKYGIVPFGIGIRGFMRLKEAAVIKQGMAVHGGLCFSIPEAGFRIKLNLARGEPSCYYSNIGMLFNGTIVSNLRNAFVLLTEEGNIDGMIGLLAIVKDLLSPEDWLSVHFNNSFVRACYSSVKLLLAGLKDSNEYMMAEALEKLIGVGKGLTPSMDDVLSGFIYTFNYFERRPEKKQNGFSLLKSLIILKSNIKTGKISAAYLVAAACGEYFELLEKAVFSILSGSSEENVKNAFRQLIQIGSSSGTAIAIGIILACCYLVAANE